MPASPKPRDAAEAAGTRRSAQADNVQAGAKLRGAKVVSGAGGADSRRGRSSFEHHSFLFWGKKSYADWYNASVDPHSRE